MRIEVSDCINKRFGCCDNLREENLEVWRVNDDIESCGSNGQQTTNLSFEHSPEYRCVKEDF